MRWLFAALFSLALTAAGVAANVEFVRVWPQWQAAVVFDRIGEYFGVREVDERDVILRTQPNDRAGMYFLARVKTDAPLPDARFVVEVIRPDSPEVKQFTFPVTVPKKGDVFRLGLTGQDWPGGEDAHPVAWNLMLLDAAGNVVASKHSFLWAKPTP